MTAYSFSNQATCVGEASLDLGRRIIHFALPEQVTFNMKVVLAGVNREDPDNS